MSPDNIMRSDVLDIIFENRNKAYGAYSLRKNYEKRIRIALLIVTTLALTLSLMNQLKPEPVRTTEFVINDIDSLEKVDPIKPKEPEPPQRQQPDQVAAVDFQTPRIVPDDTPVDTMPPIDDIANAVISDHNAAGDSTGDRLLTVHQPDPIPETHTEPAAPETPVVYEFAEKMPMYPGGKDALVKFMQRNLQQPDDMEEGQKIVVIAKFIVREDGSVDEAGIQKTGRNDLDKEVLRVIRKMPKWEPGKQNGRSVSVWFQLPVTFMTEN